jgi:hypothetical protein
MRCTGILAILAVVAAGGGDYHLDRPILCTSTDDVLQYDDGTANWLTWSGLYRGVWWDLDDFIPGLPGCGVCEIEYWFFHHASYPWDTASFYAELYNGAPEAPTTLEFSESVTAVHYQPCHAEPDDVWVYNNFWTLVNTEMSSGGWPALLGDNTPQTVSHSFFSDDFIVWEPWVIQGPTANDLFIRATPGMALLPCTWGGIKALF